MVLTQQINGGSEPHPPCASSTLRKENGPAHILRALAVGEAQLLRANPASH